MSPEGPYRKPAGAGPKVKPEYARFPRELNDSQQGEDPALAQWRDGTTRECAFVTVADLHYGEPNKSQPPLWSGTDKTGLELQVRKFARKGVPHLAMWQINGEIKKQMCQMKVEDGMSEPNLAFIQLAMKFADGTIAKEELEKAKRDYVNSQKGAVAKHKRISKKPTEENVSAEDGSAAPEVGEDGAEEEELLEPSAPRLDGESEEEEANARESLGAAKRLAACIGRPAACIVGRPAACIGEAVAERAPARAEGIKRKKVTFWDADAGKSAQASSAELALRQDGVSQCQIPAGLFDNL